MHFSSKKCNVYIINQWFFNASYFFLWKQKFTPSYDTPYWHIWAGWSLLLFESSISQTIWQIEKGRYFIFYRNIVMNLAEIISNWGQSQDEYEMSQHDEWASEHKQSISCSLCSSVCEGIIISLHALYPTTHMNNHFTQHID